MKLSKSAISGYLSCYFEKTSECLRNSEITHAPQNPPPGDGRFDYGEERWVAFGLIGKRLQVMVYTFRAETIRIISFRKANKREKAYYETQT